MVKEPTEHHFKVKGKEEPAHIVAAALPPHTPAPGKAGRWFYKHQARQKDQEVPLGTGCSGLTLFSEAAALPFT